MKHLSTAFVTILVCAGFLHAQAPAVLTADSVAGQSGKVGDTVTLHYTFSDDDGDQNRIEKCYYGLDKENWTEIPTSSLVGAGYQDPGVNSVKWASRDQVDSVAYHTFYIQMSVTSTDCTYTAIVDSLPTAKTFCVAGAIGDTICLGGGTTGSTPIEIYDVLGDSWTSGTSFSWNTGCAAVVLHDSLFVIGGMGTNAMNAYDPRQDSWTAKPSMGVSRGFLGAAAVGDSIYVVGGFNGSVRVDTVEVFDATSGTWSLGPPLSVGRQALAVVSLDRAVYAIGGFDGTNRLDLVEKLHVDSSQWEAVASLPQPLNWITAVATGDRIYALGGEDSAGNAQGTVYEYNPETDLWRQLNSFNEPRTRMGAAYADTNSAVYAIGGADASSTIRAIVEKMYPADYSNTVEFGPLELDNNEEPTITIWAPEGEQSDTIVIRDSAWDYEGDAANWLRVFPKYSLDGITWQSASFDRVDTAGGWFVESMYDSIQTWFSATDLVDIDNDSVYYIAEIVDVGGEQSVRDTGNADTIIIHVDNYHKQSVSLTTPVAEQTGNVDIHYTVYDSTIEDTIRLQYFYSIDDGTTWNTATTTGDTLLDWSLYPDSLVDSLVWNSTADIDSVDLTNVLFKIVPWDNWAAGIADSTDTFHVDNNWVPVCSLPPIPGKQGGSFPVDFVLSDRESDTLGIHCYYSIDVGTTWQPATVSGNDTALDVSLYSSSITWASGVDVAGLDLDTVLFMVLPYDNDSGIADTIIIAVDNDSIPVCELTDITTEQHDSVTLYYALADTESNVLSIEGRYSLDGSTWSIATLSGLTSGIDSSAYDSSVVWLSKVDLPDYDVKTLYFLLQPFDTDSGIADTITFHLDNYQAQSCSLATPVGEQSDSITISYWVTDTTEDSLTLTPYYSIDNGSTWETPTFTGDTLIDSNGYAGSFVWLSTSDIDSVDLSSVMFKVTPTDQWAAGISGTTGSFHVDNNHLPSVSLSAISTEQSDSVVVGYALSDRESDTLSFTAFYSADGTTWSAATLSGDTSGIGSGGYSGSVTWLSATDAPGIDVPSMYFSITPFDNDTGLPDTITFHLDNYHSQSCSLATPAGQQSDSITISYWVTDNTGDSLTLAPYYSIDNGASWSTPTFIGDTVVDTGGYVGTFTWLSVSDIDSIDLTSVRFKVIPSDQWQEGIAGITDSFHVDNNHLPSVSLSAISTEQSDSVVVGYALSDRESDPLSFTAFYSTDGATWSAATLSGDTSGIGSGDYSGSVTWLSATDAAGLDVPSMYFSINPFDNDAGLPDTITFHLDNNAVPTASVGDLSGTKQTGDITITYTLADDESDTLGIQCLYSTDFGTSWNSPTVTGDTLGIVSSAYSGSIVWESAAELPGQDLTGVLFRVVPFDNDTGVPGATSFHLDNNAAPTCSLDAISGEQSGNVVISYLFADSENDVLSATYQYSKDGILWSNATITGQTSGITSSQYDSSAVWASATDLDGADIADLYFRVQPFDADPGTPDTVVFHLDNNVPPTVMLTSATTVFTGNATINMTFVDPENDSLSIVPEYYSGTWQTATIAGGATSGITSTSHEIVWQSGSDVPDADSMPILFRVTVFDADTGSWDTTSVWINNTGLPSVVLDSVSGEQSGDVRIGYVLSDIDFDTLSIAGEYSTDGSVWSAATMQGLVSGIDSSLYDSSAVWKSSTDLDGSDIANLYFRIIPSDDGNGTPDTVIFHLDNNEVPTVSLIDTPVTYVGNAVIYMTLSDAENDSLSLIAEYLDTTWKTATITGGGMSGITSTNHSIIWITSADLPEADSSSPIPFRVTVMDNDTGATDSFSVTVHNVGLPVAIVEALSGEQSGDITIDYVLSDPNNDTLSLTHEYSLDGLNWTSATVLGQTSNITSATYDSSSVWKSATDLPGADIQDLYFRITPHDPNPGVPGDIQFHLDNNAPPTVTLMDVATVFVGDATITMVLSDAENDSLSIICEYYDGTWKPATLTNSTTEGIKTVLHTVTWASAYDVAGSDSTIPTPFRVTVLDNDTGTWDSTSVYVYNLGLPSVTIDSLIGEQSDSVTLHLEIMDSDSDTVSVVVLYSLDNGAKFDTATIAGNDSSIAPEDYSLVLVWLSRQDAGGVDSPSVVIKVIPIDAMEGISGTTNAFHLDNNNVPVVTMRDYSTEQTGNVPITATVVDDEQDVPSFLFYYQVDGGAWQAATVDSQDLDDTLLTAVWYSSIDLPNKDTTVALKVVAFDNDTGTGDSTAPFQVNNRVPPVVLSVTPDSGSLFFWKTPIAFTFNRRVFTLSDSTVLIEGVMDSAYSTSVTYDATNNTALVTSKKPFVAGDTITITITNDIVDSLGVPLDGNGDGDVGSASTDSYTWTGVVGLLGDYNLDGTVDYYDAAGGFRTYWNTDSIDFEIGPASGSAPNLVPAPDQAFDFEDLAVFTQMWHWSYDTSAVAKRVSETLAKRTNGIPEIQGAKGRWIKGENGDLLEVTLTVSSVSDLASCQYVVLFDKQELEYLNTSGNAMLARDQGGVLMKADAVSGIVDIGAVRLSKKSAGVDGSGETAVITFAAKEKSDQTITVSYELRDTENATIESGIVRCEVPAFEGEKRFPIVGGLVVAPNPARPSSRPVPFDLTNRPEAVDWAEADNAGVVMQFALPTSTDVSQENHTCQAYMKIYDLMGNLVSYTPNATIEYSGNEMHTVFWTGYTSRGAPAQPGVYQAVLYYKAAEKSGKLTSKIGIRR